MLAPPTGLNRLKKTSLSFPALRKWVALPTSKRLMTGKSNSNPSPTTKGGDRLPHPWQETADSSASETAGRPAGRRARRGPMPATVTNIVRMVPKRAGAGHPLLLPSVATLRDICTTPVKGQLPTLSNRVNAVTEWSMISNTGNDNCLPLQSAIHKEL
jgi:hypothetical protein